MLLDNREEERLRTQVAEKILRYKEVRANVLEGREADRIARNLEKEKQLLEYEDMQVRSLSYPHHFMLYDFDG